VEKTRGGDVVEGILLGTRAVELGVDPAMVLDPGIQLVVAKADEQRAREVVHVARVSGGAVPASVQSGSRAVSSVTLARK